MRLALVFTVASGMVVALGGSPLRVFLASLFLAGLVTSASADLWGPNGSMVRRVVALAGLLAALLTAIAPILDVAGLYVAPVILLMATASILLLAEPLLLPVLRIGRHTSADRTLGFGEALILHRNLVPVLAREFQIGMMAARARTTGRRERWLHSLFSLTVNLVGNMALISNWLLIAGIVRGFDLSSTVRLRGASARTRYATTLWSLLLTVLAVWEIVER